MKLLLTSAGIENGSIKKELRRLVGKDFAGMKMLFCTTASNYEGGNMSEWLVEDLSKFKDLGFEIDVCDISGAPRENLLPRFEAADIFFFEGGNTQWLRKCIKESMLENKLPRLLKTRTWVGASAGSCVLCPTILNSVQQLFDEDFNGAPKDGLSLVDFQFVPHLDSPHFPKIRKENLENAARSLRELDGRKLYVVDDNSAVSVDEDTVRVVSEGRWLEIQNEK
ncbi:MAG: peptidase E [Candidatus Nomurabacteria bacterium]|jgi:dipeptidase E|nr:peptidase E [Candidatus Nomurabacteria bacterium]